MTAAIRAGTPQPSLAGILRQLRLDAGYTMAAGAAAVGVSRTSVWHWESGRQSPSEASLDKLGDLYGVQLRELLAEAGWRRPRRGFIPEPSGPWPVDPAQVDRSTWLEQLRAHEGLTTDALAEALDVRPHTIRAAEDPGRARPPRALWSQITTRRLAKMGQVDVRRLRVAWLGDLMRGIEHLADREGWELVRACASLQQLIRTLYVRGTTLTEMAQVAAVPVSRVRQWVQGDRPLLVDEARALIRFVPGASADDLEGLALRESAREGPSQQPEPGEPGSPEAVFRVLDERHVA